MQFVRRGMKNLSTFHLTRSKQHPDGVRYLVLEYCSGGDVLDRIISDGVMDEMSYLCRNKKPMGSKGYLSKLT